MARARTTGGWVGAFVRNSGYLRKWLILGVAIGTIAGLGAVIFYLALKYAGEFLLGNLGGYRPPSPAAEGGDRGSTGLGRVWAIPLVTFGGALLSAFMVAKLAPEAEGHGTDSTIEAVRTDPRSSRARAVLSAPRISRSRAATCRSTGPRGSTAKVPRRNAAVTGRSSRRVQVTAALTNWAEMP